MAPTFHQFRRPLMMEIFQLRKLIVVLFVTLSLAALALAMIWPKTYSSFVTILVDEKNIIQPLMQGAAISTEVTDRSRLVKQIISGRKVMAEVLKRGGWMEANPSPAEQELLVKKITARTEIVNLGKNLIKIQYRDESATRAQEITQLMADMFISESVLAKSEESQSAYDFIDNQTKEYHAKLVSAEKALQEFRSANLDALPGAEADVSSRMNALQTAITTAMAQLRETEIAKRSLEAQLSGEAELSVIHTREQQNRLRIAELQAEIDNLRLRYQDAHPDITQLKNQIDSLNATIAKDRQRKENGDSAATDTDIRMVDNPMYVQLKRSLSDTVTNIETLKARIANSREQMNQEISRGQRVQGGGATLSELTRDYEVNRDIYQDLLRRRETARVSMNLDRDQQGLSFKIYENAYSPLAPSGLRFIHIIGIGLVLGIVLPLALVFLRLQYDPRIRIPELIEERLHLPVINTVPHFIAPTESISISRDLRKLSYAVLLTITVITAALSLRFLQLI